MRKTASASNQCSVKFARALSAVVAFSIAPALSAVAQTSPEAAKAIGWNNRAVELAREGNSPEAESIFRAALETAQDDLVRANIAGNLADLFRREDRYLEAEQFYRAALQWRQKNLPAQSIEVAYALNNLGEIYHIEGREWEARNLIETAARNLQDQHPEAAGLPIVLSNLAVLLGHFGEFDQAEETLRAALLCFERRHQIAGREYAVTMTNLADLLCARNKFQTAGPLYDEAIGVLKNLATRAPSELASALAGRGELYARLDDPALGRQMEEQALYVLPPSGDALLRAQILRNLGNILAADGQPSDAMPYFEQSLVIQQKALGGEHPATASLLLDYASATQRAGNKSLARKLRKRAEDLIARLRTQLPTPMTVSWRDLRDSR
ncbi:MAG TPA: tetratricopeptide repeat protein [Bryobacteraceae bacterium]|nr:tetratricopeptide repeat protein [Bryobacteraceae bacterium]